MTIIIYNIYTHQDKEEKLALKEIHYFFFPFFPFPPFFPFLSFFFICFRTRYPRQQDCSFMAAVVCLSNSIFRCSSASAANLRSSRISRYSFSKTLKWRPKSSRSFLKWSLSIKISSYSSLILKIIHYQ